MNNEYELNLDEPSKKSGILSKIPRKLLIILAIVIATFFIISLLFASRPTAEKRPIPETVVRVDTITATASSYPIIVNVNGTIQAETRGNLVSQIRGEIVRTADNFRNGGSFNKGDVLVEIDPRDYQAELSRAAASLSQADVAYRQELANAKQAENDWKRLGNTEPAPDLVRRKPQLQAAKAQLDSAKAAHQTAKLSLSRTKIKAPYSGRIIRRNAVLGQYVSVGTPIAELFAIDGVEVRLPISQDEFSQLGLDNFDPKTAKQDYEVILGSTVGGKDYKWTAVITRTDSAFDLNTRQIDVFAEVKDPFSKSTQQPPLKIGQFVTGQLRGRNVDGVFVVPNKSVREGRYTYVVRDQRLAKQNIDIVWQDDRNTLVASGLNEGDLVVTTSLNSTLAGAKAKLSEPANNSTEPATDSPVTETATQQTASPEAAPESAKEKEQQPESSEAPSDDTQAAVEQKQSDAEQTQSNNSASEK